MKNLLLCLQTVTVDCDNMAETECAKYICFDGLFVRGGTFQERGIRGKHDSVLV